MNPSFWRSKRVFLTGHTGFKGSWLSLWLQSLGAEVTGFAQEPPTQPSLFVEARIGDGMRSVLGDIRDLPHLQRSLQEARPDVVFHMAAQPLVRYSYANPVETYAVNVMGTVHLLESVRHSPTTRAVVIVTSDKCYDNREWVWGYRETEPMGGYDPYSNSKGCVELVSAAYRSSFFNAQTEAAVATARAGNVIGGGDWAQERLIPDLLRGFERGEVVHIRNPAAVRPWQHVMEPLRGYMTLAQSLYEHGHPYAEGWNFGPTDEDAKPVQWIAERMAGLWGQGAQWSLEAGQHPHEAKYLKLDISKARNRLNWHPALCLDEALKLIVEWSRQRRSGNDVADATQAQIKRYQQCIQG